jgi:hypothetical protein
MKPVAARITEIEEQKKTTEYEGFIKEATPTGSMDVPAVTCLEKIGLTVGPGGFIDKESLPVNAQKIIGGTNYGAVVLIDTSRKMVLDTYRVPQFDGRRVLDISSATIEWVGT